MVQIEMISTDAPQKKHTIPRQLKTASVHFWLFLILPFTHERLQQTTFLTIHKTTIVKLLAGYVFLQLILCAYFVVFVPFFLVLRRYSASKFARGLSLFPVSGYFILIVSKWLSNHEFVPIAGTSLFLAAVLYSTRSSGGISRSIRSFMDVSIPTNIVLVAILSASTLPLFVWDEPTTAANRPLSSTTNLVWIIFDELGANSLLNSEGDINGDVYPGFAALRQTSTWYSNTITPHTWTVKAVPSILTGSNKSVAADLPASWVENLPAQYAKFGFSGMGLPVCTGDQCVSTNYRSASGTRMLLADISIVMGHKFFPRVVSRYFPEINSAWANFGATPTRQKTLDWWLENLSETTTQGGPFATVVHSLITHHPWIHDGLDDPFISNRIDYSPDNFIPATCDDPENFQNFYCTDDLMQFNKRLFSLNSRAADEVVSRVITILEDADKLDSTMIVVTADHGFSFATDKDGRRIAPGDVYWQDLVKVPLFVKFPNQRVPTKVDTRRTTTQILQTVVNELDLPQPQAIDQSLDEPANSSNVDGVQQNLDFDVPSRWISDGGSAAGIENPAFPYAVGPLATIVGTPVSQFKGTLKRIVAMDRTVDTARDTPSKSDQVFRSLVGGHFPDSDCPSGKLAIIENDMFIGTAHRYASLKHAGRVGFWGVAQTKQPTVDPQIACVS